LQRISFRGTSSPEKKLEKIMFILSEEVLHGFSKFCLFNGINRGFHGHFLKKISPLAESAQK
jgi:hypothetical protein